MYETVVGVLGVSAPESPVTLPFDAVFRRPTKQENTAYFQGIPGSLVGYKVDLSEGLIFIDAQESATLEVLWQLEIALQLSTNSAVGFWDAHDGEVKIPPSRWVQVGHYRQGADQPPPTAGAPPPSAWEAQHVFSAWSSLEQRSDSATCRRIERAMRRYQRALEETDDEAVFHLVSACEALVNFAHNEKKRQKRFLKRVSGALRLRNLRANQRRNLEEDLKSFWKRRSGFAHGDEIAGEPHPEVLRDITHRLLRIAVDSPERFKESVVKNLG